MQIVGVRVWTFLLGHPNLFSNSPYHTHLQRVNAHLSDQEEFSALSQTSINTTNTKISGWKDGNLPGEIKQEKWEDSSVSYKLCWGSQFGIIFLGVKTLGILWKYQRQHPRQDNMFLIWVLLFLLFFFSSFVLCLFFFLFFVHSSFPLFLAGFSNSIKFFICGCALKRWGYQWNVPAWSRTKALTTKERTWGDLGPHSAGPLNLSDLQALRARLGDPFL